MSLLLWALVVSTACLLSIASAGSCAGGNKGTIRRISSTCFNNFKNPKDYFFQVDMFPLCGVAYKVTSDSKKIMTLTPVFNKVYHASQYSAPWDCRIATGRARVQDAKKPGEATLQLWRDELKESHLKALGAGSLELTTYSLATPVSNTRNWTVDFCTYVYKVTSGCVLGAKAPATPAPLKCPAGTVHKLGLEGIPYCEACGYDTYSTAGAAACKACPSPSRLWKVPASSRPQCRDTTQAFCFGEDEYYGEVCAKCPAGSAMTLNGDSCAVCVEGKRCCTANPSPSCPACKPGAKGKALTFSLVAIETKGAPWEKCQYQPTFRCYPKVDVTISSTCAVSVNSPAFANVYLPAGLDARPATLQPTPLGSLFSVGCGPYDQVSLSRVSNSGRFHVRDILSEMFESSVVGFSGPYFYAQHPGSSCATKFRVTKASKPAAIAPLKLSRSCPPTAKECKKPCPAGSYLCKVTGGPTLCLPCIPGTFSTKSNSATCKGCPEGMVAAEYGSKACSACPAGRYSATYCIGCDALDAYVTAPDAEGIYCASCPVGTASVDTGCISRNGTAPCCYRGKCGALPKCPRGPPPVPVAAPAVLKMASSTPSCKQYPLFACLSPAAKGGRLYLSLLGAGDYDERRDVNNAIVVIGGGRRDGPLCGASGVGLEVLEVSFSGDTSLSLFMPTGGDEASPRFFGSAQLNSKQGVDVIMWESLNIAAAIPEKGKARKPLPICKASFTLESGFLFGQQKTAASCPKGLYLTKVGGIKVCQACLPGAILKGGKCVGCGPGTYSQEYDDTAACSKCLPGWVSDGIYNGTKVDFGALSCSQCPAGSVPSYPNSSTWAECVQCPVNTYGVAGATKCKACPPGTRTTRGSGFGATFCWF